MKLYYYPVPDGNFGDYLNEIIWEHYLPDFFDDNEDELFVGIGTLLNDNLPTARRLVVFGSGVGYGSGLPTVDNTWKIYCLRGPLSARCLGVSPEVALTDPALLIHRVYALRDKPKRYRFTYIPHVHCARIGMQSWKAVCDELGFGLIDPRWSIEKVLSALEETEVILAEAMHGAILADTYGIPWIPVVSNRKILPFKWEDWCQSLKLPYAPQHTLGLWDPPPGLSKRWLSNPYHVLNPVRKKIVVKQLQSIVQKIKPILSDRRQFEQLTLRLEDKISQVQANERSSPLCLR
jgi:succinoglycan biosynthesis protein ExoV